MLEFLIVVGMFLGAGLGLRFKLLVLAPVIIFASVGVLVDGIAHGHSAWRIVVGMAAAAVSPQLGYFGVFVFRWAKQGALARHHSKLLLPTKKI
jgi:hypothetical protein